MDNSQLESDSFDEIDKNLVLANGRNKWNLAKAIDEQENSIKIIQEICENSALIQFVDRLDREKVVALEAPRPEKIRDLPFLTVDDGFDFEVTKTGLNKVFNEIFVEYRPDSISKELNGVQSVTATSGSFPGSSRFINSHYRTCFRRGRGKAATYTIFSLF